MNIESEKAPQMTVEDKQELAFTRMRVVYSNSFLENQQTKNLQFTYSWNQQSQYLLYKRMTGHNLPQIIAPVSMNPEEASEFLFRNPDLNKIHSCYLDFFEELPFRPDVGFDLLWRSLESLIRLFNREVWHNSSDNIQTIFKRLSEETISSALNESATLKSAVENLLDIIPISTCRFVFSRILIEREIRTANQFSHIRDRAKSILGEEFYEALIERFKDEETITKAKHYQGARLIKRMLGGEPFHIGDKEHSSSSLSEKIHIVISLILYTSRCERFHGDNFSHFKSDRTSIRTYCSWYWLLLSTYFIFWLLFRSICTRRKADTIATETNLAISFSESLNRYSEIFPKM